MIDLNPSNFDKLVINGDEVWIVEFFAPWCGHCKQFVPEYQKAANSLKVSQIFKSTKTFSTSILLIFKSTKSFSTSILFILGSGKGRRCECR